MFERKHDKLASRVVFLRRVDASVLMAAGLISATLCIGILGYRYIAGFVWVDSLLEASMILGGMGPVNPLTAVPAKIFAAGYALFSGLLFIAGFCLRPQSIACCINSMSTRMICEVDAGAARRTLPRALP